MEQLIIKSICALLSGLPNKNRAAIVNKNDTAPIAL